MTTIYLIRHAEAEGNRYRRAHGWYNSTITDRGYHQIAALAKRFADTKFDAVYSSDRFRTMITALAIYKTTACRCAPSAPCARSTSAIGRTPPGRSLSASTLSSSPISATIRRTGTSTAARALPRSATACARPSLTSLKHTPVRLSLSSPTAWRCASSSARSRA